MSTATNAPEVSIAPEPVDRPTPLQTPSRNFDFATLVFPLICVRFSKVPDTQAWEVVKFDDPAIFRRYAYGIGAYRVVTQVSDLADVPNKVLLGIFNTSRKTTGEPPLDRFRDRTAAETRTFEVLGTTAVDFKETTMGENETKSATGTTKTEAKAAERKLARENKAAEKATEKAAKEKARAEQRAGGIIGTIKSMLENATGATQTEILDALCAKFPDRKREGMASTVKIQCSRLAKTTKRVIVSKEIVDRGRVYKFEDVGAIPGKEVVKEAPPAAAPAAPAAPAPVAAAPTAPAAAAKPGTKPAGKK